MTEISKSDLPPTIAKILDTVNSTGEAAVVTDPAHQIVAAVISGADYELFRRIEDRFDLAEIEAARAEIAREGTVSLQDVSRRFGLST